MFIRLFVYKKGSLTNINFIINENIYLHIDMKERKIKRFTISNNFYSVIISQRHGTETTVSNQ